MSQDENKPSDADYRGSATVRSTLARKTGSHLWVAVDFDAPVEITGIASSRNRMLHDQLWSELSRLGVTQRQSPTSFIRVAGETGVGTFVRWWSSPFLIGIEVNRRRMFAFTGTGPHETETWMGRPSDAFALLARVADGAGPDGFWKTLAADTGYAEAALAGSTEEGVTKAEPAEPAGVVAEGQLGFLDEPPDLQER